MAEQEQQFTEDAARYGIPLDVLMETAEAEPELFEVWPENDLSLGVFLTCSTQLRYRTVGQGSIVSGLDYTAVETVLRPRKVCEKSRIFDDVRHMEMAMLEQINETLT